MRVSVIVSLSVLVGCTSTPETFDFPAWENVGYEGFVESIDVVAGASARNCGFFNLLTGEGRAERIRGLKCAEQAYADGAPFKYGTVLIPHDSYVYEVLLRTPTGENWRIVYDIMIDGTVPQIWFRICDSVSWARNGRAYEIHDCTPYDGSEDPVWNGT